MSEILVVALEVSVKQCFRTNNRQMHSPAFNYGAMAWVAGLGAATPARRPTQAGPTRAERGPGT